MHRPGFIKTIGLTAVAVVAIGFIWYAASQPAVGWPSEDRRVVHSAGFSVVQPKGWERNVTYVIGGRTTDAIRFVPIKTVGAPGCFNVTRITPTLATTMPAEGYTATTFLGRPAFEHESTFGYTHEHSRSIVFQRDGVWFEIAIRRPTVESLDSGLWQAYAESFKTEPVRKIPELLPEPSTPTTGPASSPASAASP